MGQRMDSDSKSLLQAEMNSLSNMFISGHRRIHLKH